MDRITGLNYVANLFGAGKNGFRDGDLPNAVYPTYLNAAWFNDAQEELLNIIEGAGVVPAAGTRTQVRQAIRRMFGGNLTTVNAGNSPFALTADHAGIVLVDATAGNASATLPAVNAVASLPLKLRFVRIDATANTATLTCAGADTLVGGAASFTLVGQAANRSIEGDSASKWSTTAVSAPAYPQLQSITAVANTPANGMTITINPTVLDFRSPALTSGAVVTRALLAPITIVVPSGATLGMKNGIAARLPVFLVDNAGTLEGVVGNLAGGRRFDEAGVISTVILDAASDSANVLYSTTARANLAYRLVGFVDVTQAAAGVHVTQPALIQGGGGLALSSIIAARTYVDETANRSISTVYYAPRDREISVSLRGTATTGGANYIATIYAPDGTTVLGYVQGSGGSTTTTSYLGIYFDVPPGHGYSVTALVGGITLNAWYEVK